MRLFSKMQKKPSNGSVVFLWIKTLPPPKAHTPHDSVDSRKHAQVMEDSAIIEFFASYAYEPMFVYGFVVLFMALSSFGMPIPEEVTLVSAGLVAYMAGNPAEFPPPSPDAEGVNLWVLTTICFVAVICSDVLIYTLGRVFGRRLVKTKFFRRFLSPKKLAKIERKFKKYKYLASGVFRFTPGVRFPGHLSCGMLGVPLGVFMLVDGAAALLSVPTQVLLVAHFGDVIIDQLTRFKLIIGAVVLAIFLIWLIRKVILYRAAKHPCNPTQ